MNTEINVSCQPTREQVQRGLLQNDFKRWVRHMKQQDIFELQRPGMSIFTIDRLWIATQDIKFQQLLEKMVNWLDCADIFPWITDFKFAQLYQISQVQRENWVQTGIGAVSQWMHWSEMNREYVERSYWVFSYSVRVVAPARVERVSNFEVMRKNTLRVKAKGSVGFDMLSVVLEPLERVIRGKNFPNERLVDRLAKARMAVEQWMLQVHGYASWATKSERFKASRVRNGVWVDSVVKTMVFDKTLSPDNPALVYYLDQFGYTYPEVEVCRLHHHYFRSLPYPRFLQYIFISTLLVRSPFRLVEEISNVVGNMVIASVGTRLMEEEDENDIFSSISRLLDNTSGDVSQMQLKPVQRFNFTASEEIDVDLMCSMDLKVGILDIERLVLKQACELRMRTRVECDNEGVTLTYREAIEVVFLRAKQLGTQKDLSRKKDRWGVPFEVSNLKNSYQRTISLPPFCIHTIISPKPIQRVSVSVGGPTWNVPLTNQPGVYLYTDPKNLCSVQFCLGAVFGNVWIMIKTEDGFGLRKIGHFPEISLPVTDVCKTVLPAETGACVCNFVDPETSEGFAFYRAENEHIGMWVANYRGIPQSRVALDLSPTRWALIEDEFGRVEIPMVWKCSFGMKSCSQIVVGDQYIGALPEMNIEEYGRGEKPKF